MAATSDQLSLQGVIRDHLERIRKLEAAMTIRAAGIDFNKVNDTDINGAVADYLSLILNGATPTYTSTAAAGPLSLLILNADSSGNMAIVQSTNGYLLLANAGDGDRTGFLSEHDYGGKMILHGAGPGLTRPDTVSMTADGLGTMFIRSTSGMMAIINSGDGGLLIEGGGAGDVNGVTLKNFYGFGDFLIAGDHASITRNPAAPYNVTAMTYSDERLRINATDFIITGLPTVNPGGTNKVWRNGNVLNIT